jgi:hypothetical protein
MEVSGQLNGPAALPPGRYLCTYSARSKVLENRKSLAAPRIRGVQRAVGHVVVNVVHLSLCQVQRSLKISDDSKCFVTSTQVTDIRAMSD